MPRDRALAGCYRITESGDDNAREQTANAHLIAAAPDLLAACQLAFEKLETTGEYPGIADQLRIAIDATQPARAAATPTPAKAGAQ